MDLVMKGPFPERITRDYLNKLVEWSTQSLELPRRMILIAHPKSDLLSPEISAMLKIHGIDVVEDKKIGGSNAPMPSR